MYSFAKFYFYSLKFEWELLFLSFMYRGENDMKEKILMEKYSIETNIAYEIIIPNLSTKNEVIRPI